MIKNGTQHLKPPKNQNRRAAFVTASNKTTWEASTSLRSTNPRPYSYFETSNKKWSFLIQSPAGHRFTCPKSITKIAIRRGQRNVTADSDIKCHVTPVLSDYSPCLRFSVIRNVKEIKQEGQNHQSFEKHITYNT